MGGGERLSVIVSWIRSERIHVALAVSYCIKSRPNIESAVDGQFGRSEITPFVAATSDRR